MILVMRINLEEGHHIWDKVTLVAKQDFLVADRKHWKKIEMKIRKWKTEIIVIMNQRFRKKTIDKIYVNYAGCNRQMPRSKYEKWNKCRNEIIRQRRLGHNLEEGNDKIMRLQ